MHAEETWEMVMASDYDALLAQVVDLERQLALGATAAPHRP